MEDEELILTAFEAGQLHLALPLDIDWEKYNQSNKVRIYEFISQNYEFLGFNLQMGYLGVKMERVFGRHLPMVLIAKKNNSKYIFRSWNSGRSTYSSKFLVTLGRCKYLWI